MSKGVNTGLAALFARKKNTRAHFHHFSSASVAEKSGTMRLREPQENSRPGYDGWRAGLTHQKKRGHPERSVGVGEGGGLARSEEPSEARQPRAEAGQSREQQDGEREEICRKVCPEFTGFFGCALPATFARRASLRLRMSSDFDASALGWRASSLPTHAATGWKPVYHDRRGRLPS